MKDYVIETRTIDEQPTAAMKTTLGVEGIGPWLGGAYGAVAGYLARHGAGPVGMPYARFHRLGAGEFEIEAGFPATHPIAGEGDVVPSTLPGGEVAVTVHVGPYEDMTPAYDALTAWAAERGFELVGDAWEVYFSDPVTVPDPAEWRTEIVQPYHPA